MFVEKVAQLQKNINYKPVNGDGDEGKDAGDEGLWHDKLSELAVVSAEWPTTTTHIDKVKHGVEDCDEGVRNGKVHEEVIRDSAHSSVADDNPNHDHITPSGHEDHCRKCYSIKHLDVPWHQIGFTCVGTVCFQSVV